MAILILILFLALLATIAVAILWISNSNVITVAFLSWSFNSPLAPMLLASFGAGGLLGWLITVPGSIKKSLAIAGSKKKIENMEKQLAAKTYNLPKVDDAAIHSATATPSDTTKP